MEKIRIGLIGCGGRSTAHRHSFAQMDNVQVVAVADPVEARRAEASRQFGGARMYRDDAEFYARESRDTVDAVVICVEPTAHAISEERAIDLGIPFLVEKPMTLDLAQADRIALTVNVANPTAQRAYFRAGFVDTGERYAAVPGAPQLVLEYRL